MNLKIEAPRRESRQSSICRLPEARKGHGSSQQLLCSFSCQIKKLLKGGGDMRLRYRLASVCVAIAMIVTAVIALTSCYFPR